MPEALHFIANTRGLFGDAAEIPVIDPTTATVVGHAAAGSAATVDRAVAAASSAQPGWAESAPAERAAALTRLADGLEAASDRLTDVLAAELGMPRALCQAVQIDPAVEVLRDTAEAVPAYRFVETLRNSTVYRVPVGVVGGITPWNYPLLQVACKLAPAVAAGCAIVLKVSEATPFSIDVLCDALADCGLPPGVVNILHGTGPVAGAALAAHPRVRKVSFTGSTAVGKAVAARAAEDIKRVSLELGGKSAMLVLPDCDPAPAVDWTVDNVLVNSGQTCSALTRLIVPHSQHDAVAERAAAALARWPVGDPRDPATRTGPLVTARQQGRVAGYIEAGLAGGARLVAGGPGSPAGLNHGCFVRPTVFAQVDPATVIAQEEIFGPVLAILSYPDGAPEAGLAIANGTAYGLYGAVWGPDTAAAARVARRMQAGQVEVNGAPVNSLAPFGGLKQSGYGREGGPFAIDDYVELQAIQLPVEAG